MNQKRVYYVLIRNGAAEIIRTKKRVNKRNSPEWDHVMETKEKKYEEELADDIMKILTCYSARYYGARGGRKKKNKVENESVESNGI